ncbi:hypothetical protein HDU92_007409 [Lobulomyces angularis]|nr:hypothetical protein HDU92_007409 [Lobulomyces angularis]
MQRSTLSMNKPWKKKMIHQSETETELLFILKAEHKEELEKIKSEKNLFMKLAESLNSDKSALEKQVCSLQAEKQALTEKLEKISSLNNSLLLKLEKQEDADCEDKKMDKLVKEKLNLKEELENVSNFNKLIIKKLEKMENKKENDDINILKVEKRVLVEELEKSTQFNNEIVKKLETLEKQVLDENKFINLKIVKKNSRDLESELDEIEDDTDDEIDLGQEDFAAQRAIPWHVASKIRMFEDKKITLPDEVIAKIWPLKETLETRILHAELENAVRLALGSKEEVENSFKKMKDGGCPITSFKKQAASCPISQVRRNNEVVNSALVCPISGSSLVEGNVQKSRLTLGSTLPPDAVGKEKTLSSATLFETESNENKVPIKAEKIDVTSEITDLFRKHLSSRLKDASFPLC